MRTPFSHRTMIYSWSEAQVGDCFYFHFYGPVPTNLSTSQMEGPYVLLGVTGSKGYVNSKYEVKAMGPTGEIETFTESDTVITEQYYFIRTEKEGPE